MRKRIGAAAAVVLLGLGLAVAVSSPASAAVFGPYQIRPAADSTKCLEIQGGSTANGAVAQLNNCYSGWWNQQWYLYSVPGCFQCYQLVPRHSWKCLDVTGVSQDNGAIVQQFDCLGYGQANQVWQKIDYNGGLTSTYSPTHSWKILVHYGTYPGAPVVQSWQLNYWALFSV